jgi:hypothetical protein
MKKPTVLIAPGLGLFLIGTLMLVALTAFRSPPSEAEARVASSASSGAIPALVTAPRAELIPGVVAAARELREVAAVAEIRSGTRWVTGWSADGAPELVPPAGYRMPVDVAAVDPEHYRNLVPEPLRAMFADMANGGAIVSRTGASLRGIRELGHLQFQGASVPVIGVVHDELIRNHEVMVSHGTGEALGLHETRYLAIGLKELSSGRRVEEAMRGAIPPGTFMRVRGPDGSGASSAPSPLLSLARIKTTFGEFPAITGAGSEIRIEQGWIDSNIEWATMPVLGTFRCHKKLIPQMRAAFEEVHAAGLGGLIRPGDFGGCFSPRFIQSGDDVGLSRHAWGAAFDFNVSTNLYGHTPTMDRQLVEIMERHGFTWGGHWNTPDGMHFEFVAPR